MSWIPVRRCAACGRRGDKRSFIRVVRLPEGGFSVDEPLACGRGAYVCRCERCVGTAVRKHSLDRVYGQSVPVEIYDKLRVGVECDGRQ